MFLIAGWSSPAGHVPDDAAVVAAPDGAGCEGHGAE